MSKLRFIFFLLVCQVVSAQNITVLDEETGEAIHNVAIYNVNKTEIILSDALGKCDLSIFAKNERIIFKHIGHKTRKGVKAQFLKRGNIIYLTLKAEELDEIVMSISKWEQQKKDIPQKIVSINAKAIQFTNPQTSADLLQKSGKVFVQKSQLGGGSPMIRGFATNRLLLIVDGVRMNNAIFRGGNVQNIISIDPYTIKNTEVIFGPSSVIYGSDALGGVINFFTKRPRFSTKDSLILSGNGNYRFSSANDENTYHFDFNVGREKWALLTSISYNRFDDLTMGENGPDSYLRKKYAAVKEGKDILIKNKNPKNQLPSGYNQINLTQKFAYKPTDNWNLNLGLYYSETSDYPRYDRLIRPSKDGTGLRYAEWYYGPQKWFMGNLQIYKKGQGKFYDRLKITTAYQHFEESRNKRSFNKPKLFSTKEKVDAISTNIDFENKRTNNLNLYYGAQYIYNKVGSFGSHKNIKSNVISSAPTRYPNGATWQTLASYINTEYKMRPNVTFLSGLHYSYVWIDAIFDKTYYSFPFDNANLATGALTGSLGVSWFPQENLQFTLNGSTGFRAPNIDDIGKVFDSEPGAVVVPNPDLEAEYAYNVELGIRKKFNDKIVITGAAFYTYLVDALVRRDFYFGGVSQIKYDGELSDVQAIQNAAKAYIYGFELEMETFLTENFSISSNFTLTKGKEEEEDGSESPVRHIAPAFGDVHIVWKNKRIKADIFLNYNGEIAFVDLASSEQKKTYIYAADINGKPYAPSWHTLNFRSQYTISNAFKASFGIENITNQAYRTYSSGIVAPGTNFILGLGYRF